MWFDEWVMLPAGVPNWVDLVTPDLAGAKAFYGELFGWVPNVSPDDQFGGYSLFTLAGRAVAGAGPLLDPAQPTTWSTYVATDDADETARRVTANGGTVVMGPTDVGDQGRMAAFRDPPGAPFSVWQPGALAGAGAFNEPGCLTWNELATPDPGAAAAFYGAVFEWTASEDDSYLVWRSQGRPIGGMVASEGPSQWAVYFQVEDADRTCATATTLGGRVISAPTTIPQGRKATLADPSGATFAILAPSP